MATVIDYVGMHKAAKTFKEKYAIQHEALTKLSEEDGDRFFDILCLSGDIAIPHTVHMGLNTEPGDRGWDDLVKEVCEYVERDGIATASWSCTGRTRHMIHSQQLQEALPQYDFDITYESYGCTIKKRG